MTPTGDIAGKEPLVRYLRAVTSSFVHSRRRGYHAVENENPQPNQRGNIMSAKSRRIALLLLGGLTSAVITTRLPGSVSGPGDAVDENGVKMTWFGITNWHYQVGDLGILLDGAVSFGGQGESSGPDLVRRARDALAADGASFDVVLLGHLHGDHSSDIHSWVRETGAKYFAPEEACAEAIAEGLACNSIYGGETVQLSARVTMRVVRWSHSVRCGVVTGGTDSIETFGFLFTSESPSGTLAWFVTDSGAGGVELVTDRIVNGRNHGAPLHNLLRAVRDAGIPNIDVWQAGPESRVINQARVIVPVFDVKYLMAHHFGARGGFDLLGGLHYAYDPGEVPRLTSFLESQGVPKLFGENYMDAWMYDHDGVRRVENTRVKTALGLPARGPGPRPQQSNPRGGELECADD